jgi:hypothetical protein
MAHIKVSVPQNQAFVVGWKSEVFRNQVCQGEGNKLQQIPRRSSTPVKRSRAVGKRHCRVLYLCCVPYLKNAVIFRVPTYLGSKFGKYVESKNGGLPRNINRLPVLATTYQCPIVCENWIF